MEQTLGKRIAQHRKRMGLTQDMLAEKLGITAQAVSKWENDQSCPDITILPKLAEIFGITTDALLGREAPPKTYTAEIVTEGEDEDDSRWEFHWDNGKRDSLRFAFLVLWVGGLTLASRLLHWDASFGEILWPSVLLFWGLRSFIRDFSIFKLCLVVCGGGYLINNLGIWNIAISSELIFPVLVVLFGVSLLIDALKKPNRSRFRIMRKGSVGTKTKNHCVNKDDCFSCHISFCEETHRVTVPVLASGDASVSFGELTVDLRDCLRLQENCTVDAQCSFGELQLLVPKRFRVECDSSTSFASLSIDGDADAQPDGVITLNANVSFGEITIRYM